MRVFNRSILQKMLYSPRRYFCVDTEPTKKILAQQLFSIDLINKNVNRHILSMEYSPGVGAVC